MGFTSIEIELKKASNLIKTQQRLQMSVESKKSLCIIIAQAFFV